VDQPCIVAGRGGGALKYPGVHYRSSSGENTTDILISCLRTLDPSIKELGSEQGYSNKACDAILV
jgi:hypothetical protein